MSTKELVLQSGTVKELMDILSQFKDNCKVAILSDTEIQIMTADGEDEVAVIDTNTWMDDLA